RSSSAPHAGRTSSTSRCARGRARGSWPPRSRRSSRPGERGKALARHAAPSTAGPSCAGEEARRWSPSGTVTHTMGQAATAPRAATRSTGARVVNLFDRILRADEGRELRRLEASAQRVGQAEDVCTELTDDELRAETAHFKERLEDGEALDDVMVEAFAAVREAARRTLGQRPYDVQIMGGAALHRGRIAEMKTGEGKTLVATLPAYLNALAGKGVHVVTVNDYLASYQSDLMGRVFRFLGLTTGVITAGMTPAERRE